MNDKNPQVCRFCGTPLRHTFVDLGSTPLSNSYLDNEALQRVEPVYPLHAKVCSNCYLVQVDDVVPPTEIFSHYTYFSSYSDTWLNHAKAFVEKAIERFSLDAGSKVVEIASNDGYLLRNFVQANIACLGVEPAQNVAKVAIQAGIPTEIAFFGEDTAERLRARGDGADLIVANNVLAHVPDLNGFVEGFKILLKPEGVVTIEVPHILKLITENQFDTIYHEHFSYFSLYTLEQLFKAHQLRVFDAEELSTHGGSLRLFVCHAASSRPTVGENLAMISNKEAAAGLNKLEGYTGFAAAVRKTCTLFTEFIDQEMAKGKTFAAYGAAAKGNTLLNVCNIKSDKIAFVVDKNPAKQEHYLPGSHIPIFPPEKIFAEKPDYLVILPWNLANEVCEQMKNIRSWGAKFVTAIPEVRVLE